MVRRAHTLRREDGQATVEFAIVIPLLLLLVVGIFEFGKAFNYWIDLNHLSNEGARWAAVDKVPPYNGISGNASPSCDAIKQFLLSQMNTGDLQGKVTAANIKVRVDNPSGPTPQIGDAVTVSIEAPGYKIASLGETINLGTVNLGSKSTMRLEQVPSWYPCL
jgi:Flp pilus assembly protein TadG